MNDEYSDDKNEYLNYSQQVMAIVQAITDELTSLDTLLYPNDPTVYYPTELRFSFKPHVQEWLEYGENIPIGSIAHGGLETCARKALDHAIDPVESTDPNYITTSKADEIGYRIWKQLEKDPHNWEDLLLMMTKAFRVADLESEVRYVPGIEQVSVPPDVEGHLEILYTLLEQMNGHLTSMGVISYQEALEEGNLPDKDAADGMDYELPGSN